MPQKEITLNVLLVAEHTQTEMKVLELVLRTLFYVHNLPNVLFMENT